MKIAIEGCMHGDLDNVYRTLKYIEERAGTKIDLLLCCGDFQAVRNEADMESLNVPRKYREMNSFWKYYSVRVPNAENLKVFAEKGLVFVSLKFANPYANPRKVIDANWYYGGWAAPNMYFLGYAGVIKFGDIRIGGLSGIYNERHYKLGHFERPPYNESTIRSVYHVREYDVHKLMQIEEPMDIFLSHDWPLGITDCGNSRDLIRQKPFFEKEIQRRTLGSKAAAQLLEKLKPTYWFSAHLHCKFAASVQHGGGGPITKFLALDKCKPRGRFLQIIDVEAGPGPYAISYDEEWLAITRKFNSILPLTVKSANFGAAQHDIQDCRNWVQNRLQVKGTKPCDFVRTAPCFDPSHRSHNDSAELVRNPQTESFLELLELSYLLNDKFESIEVADGQASSIQQGPLGEDSEEIAIDDVDELEELAEDEVEH